MASGAAPRKRAARKKAPAKPAAKKAAPKKTAAKPEKAEVLVGNLFELASLPDMPSEPKLRDLIRTHPEFPVIKHGTNGSAYQIDLAKGRDFVLGLAAAEQAKLRDRAEQVKQFGLDLLGGDAASMDRRTEGLTAQERKALIEEELAAMKLAEKRDELVRKNDIESAFGEFVVMIKQRGDNFAARLAKKIDLTREQIVATEKLVRADQRAIASAMEAMGNAAGLEPDRDSTVRNGRDDDRPGGEPDEAEG